MGKKVLKRYETPKLLVHGEVNKTTLSISGTDVDRQGTMMRRRQ